MSQIQYVQGIFKEEIKNRFLCLVTVGDEDVLCYIPSSCRLSNFIDIKGRKVLLVPVASPKARTKYSVFAVWTKRRYIPVNLSSINGVIYNELHRKIFSFLGKRKSISREVTIDGYKSDLYISDTKTVIEIKCILSFTDIALFPTVFSERANAQLSQLKLLLKKGFQVCYMLISLNPSVKTIEINSAIPEYYNAFCDCVNNGMKVCGYSVTLRKNEIKIYKRLDVTISK